jgi:hypothetical protein
MPALPLRAARLALPLASIALVGTVARSVAGDVVKGRITGQETLVGDQYVDASKNDGHHYTWREPSPTVRAEFRTLSGNPSRDLCIAALSTAGNQPPQQPILIKVTGERTIPSTLVITPGTKLAFENRDPFPHRLYIVGSPTWKAESIAPGQRREWSAPPNAGRIEIRDELFPSVRSFVVIEPTVAAIAFPGRDNSFSFDLPPGDYVLKAFFGGRQVGRPVQITAKDKPFDLKDPLSVAAGGG